MSPRLTVLSIGFTLRAYLWRATGRDSYVTRLSLLSHAQRVFIRPTDFFLPAPLPCHCMRQSDRKLRNCEIVNGKGQIFPALVEDFRPLGYILPIHPDIHMECILLIGVIHTEAEQFPLHSCGRQVAGAQRFQKDPRCRNGRQQAVRQHGKRKRRSVKGHFPLCTGDAPGNPRNALRFPDRKGKVPLRVRPAIQQERK